MFNDSDTKTLETSADHLDQLNLTGIDHPLEAPSNACFQPIASRWEEEQQPGDVGEQTRSQEDDASDEDQKPVEQSARGYPAGREVSLNRAKNAGSLTPCQQSAQSSCRDHQRDRGC
jgi:hypothetical protein